MTSRMWNLSKIILVKLPTARMLRRTAAISSALLVMQLHAFKNSRRAFVIFVHFIASALSSHISCDLCNPTQSTQRKQQYATSRSFHSPNTLSSIMCLCARYKILTLSKTFFSKASRNHVTVKYQCNKL
ncbi:uncharacterized protein PHALS_14612 [Plasmopara halstedii]|uniref:Uncharacterized protein n=1 Tax=Plasmopara halstedii TaxID=4781 RepID=A0A0P1AMX5_PLAHL|nr:uncharacterized protein PHALS_14612 [Plasmopara halstedii]CEG42317.1 hypothetical protein PHALS_14612 [Plasmopara halstedii]|eukprot:XP_024578686.1 hypothetical protein PHALS_14612 [Plasmopara halstedii]